MTVVGGGAAGIFAAIAAARAHRHAQVIVFEATGELLDKVRISGGGRCNVTHHCFDPAELVKGYPRGYRELRGPFTRFQPKDTVAWFKKRGVQLKAEADGRMFPVTDDSGTIVNCLTTSTIEAGVQLRLNARVKGIAATEGGDNSRRFQVELHDGTSERFDRVLIATGSSPQGYRFAQGLGHTIVPTVPSLFTFKITDPRIQELAGVSFEKVRLSLLSEGKHPLEQTGPMLITHWGLSGPAVLKLSAWGARELHEQKYRAALQVNFLPSVSRDQVYTELAAFKEAHGRRRVSSESRFGLPKRYWEKIVQAAGIPDDNLWATLSREAMTVVTRELTEARFAIRGKGIFKDEFVSCGGVDLREVDFRTMESKHCPGLFFAGEVLDIDGITGGYNFQAAWTTGWIAGLSMGA